MSKKIIDIGSCSPYHTTRDILPLGSITGEVLCVCVCVCFLLFYKVTCGQMDSFGPSNHRIERVVLETHSEVLKYCFGNIQVFCSY